MPIYKGKGSKKDPSYFRGIFQLDVCGNVLSSVLNRRIQKATELHIGDEQNGFRAKRSTAHSIHVLRRAQEAVRSADYLTIALFVDFKKAFDSPPRGALYECLTWIGVPSDVVAVIAAIYENPKGKVVGTKAWFKVSRGIRQGCVLGPTMFILLLEFCLRMTDLSDIGVVFRCARRSTLPLPADLETVSFTLRYGGYADDIVLFGPSAEALSEALRRIQEVSGSIGLDINVGKTEWLYLHHPQQEVTAGCEERRRQKQVCCERVKMGNSVISHVGSFTYLGTIVSEAGGMRKDVMSKTARAAAALAKYSALWCSRLSMKTKLRYLRSQVLSILLYGCEPGNHMEGDLKIMARFLRRCMVKLASRRKLSRMRGTVLMRPLDLMSRPRVSFIAQLLVDPPSELARRMTFAVVANPTRPRDRRIAARDRAAYWNVLSRDMRFLSTDSPVSHTLEDVQEVYRAGKWRNRLYCCIELTSLTLT